MLTKNIKCPKCKKPILRERIKATGGKCPFCDYQIIGLLRLRYK
jgi:DNA-directed RNA polymerase subunit RPC12/RpoP